MSTTADNLARLAGAVEVWLAAPAALAGEAAAATLDAGERERAARFLRDEPRATFVAAHGLVRRVLSHYAERPPEAWRFRVGEHGRPDVDPDASGLSGAARDLAFNLSHTRGLVAVAVARLPGIGVDVEWTPRQNDLERLARAKFAAAERAHLARETDAAAFRRRFFRYWTLKESYLKARGTGITLPLGAFAFDVEPGRPVGVTFDAELADDPAAWQFDARDVGAEHALAVGLRRGVGAPDRALRVLWADDRRP